MNPFFALGCVFVLHLAFPSELCRNMNICYATRMFNRHIFLLRL